MKMKKKTIKVIAVTAGAVAAAGAAVAAVCFAVKNKRKSAAGQPSAWDCK